MQPQEVAKAHPFGPTLEDYAMNGVPVDCGEDWTREQIIAAVERGPHVSVLRPEAIALFQEDIAYQVAAGFCRIVEWDSMNQKQAAPEPEDITGGRGSANKPTGSHHTGPVISSPAGPSDYSADGERGDTADVAPAGP